jgi:RND superfamily putative drug exporter
VREQVRESFAGQSDSRVLLVAQAAESTDAEEFETDFSLLLNEIAGLDGVEFVRNSRTETIIPGLSQLDGAYLALIGLQAGDLKQSLHIVKEIRSLLPVRESFNAYLTGGPANSLELQEIGKQDARRAEVFGLGISLIVLVIVFGALTAALLPLMVAIGSITISFTLLFFLGHVIGIAIIAQMIVSLLGLATGIDYALLMVNRFREELGHGRAPLEAAQTTSLTAGRSILISGLTVLVALASLLVPPLNFIRTIGIASIIVMLFSVAISLTALPACLALLGERVNWLKVTRSTPGLRSRAFWQALAERRVSRPWFWTIFSTVILLLLSLPATRMDVALAGSKGLAETTDTRKAQAILEPLNLASLEKTFDILIDFEQQGFYHPSSVRAVAQFTRGVRDLDHVGQVLSAASLQGVPSLLLHQYLATPETAAQSPFGELVSATVSRDGRYALVRIFPTGSAQLAEIDSLDRGLHYLVEQSDLNASIGGGFVASREWKGALYRSFPLALSLVYLATYILLGLVFRSLWIPLKSILLNTLTVGAAFGVITAVFQHGWFASLLGWSSGLGFVEASVPFFIFAVVFGLSMDYEVFLVSRIYEGHKRNMSDRRAVVYALSTTGSVISSAALIMLIVFVAFLSSRLVIVQTLGVGLSVAVILDATLVRFALVPAVMLLLGKWNWWLPQPFARFAEKVNLSHD